MDFLKKNEYIAYFTEYCDFRCFLSIPLVSVVSKCISWKNLYIRYYNFSYYCSEFVVTTRSRELSIYDARTGEKQCSTQLVHDGTMLSRVLFYGTPEADNSERLITTGSSRSTRRQVAIYNSRPLDAPLAVVDIDGASGFLMPLVDNDLNLLYIAGKVDLKSDF